METEDTSFNFDLEQMKKAVESNKIVVPNFNSFEEFDEWLSQDD